MKELLSMQRHRGLFLKLAMVALLGFMGNQVQAGTVTISVDLEGVGVIYSTTGSVNINALNTDLVNAGSAYQFEPNGLSASTTGTLTTAGLSTSGFVTVISGAGLSTTPALSVDVVESNILAPTGTGSLSGSAGVNYTQVPSGSTSFTGDYQTPPPPVTTVTPTFTLAASGTNGGGTTFPSMSLGAVAGGYSLSNHFIISLDPATASTGGTDSFGGGVVLTATTIPEPASIVMLLTGMPLPLAIVFGLMRRRRAEA
jgi:hypothetical protein